ncbi:MAG: hypothetical protein P0Y56_02090 [Candidatus Andeanibacterium colombiense]|uniref:Uncharacterized protein n=1 Tax=Candidatus Andeanibacterium colombiense TaxID=3121345 RepID=A0AAJ5X610_9SPHN|nr:MAG: hypothetical protein P0Y56_02090 [Sphingomonadaceae bacterium]
MSDAKRTTLRERIEAGQARQAKRTGPASGPIDKLTAVAKEHPLLVVLGGIAVGVAVSTLIPRSPTRRLSRNALGFLTTVAELGIAYGRQALDAADDASQPTRERLGDFGGSLLDSAGKLKDRLAATRD